MENWTQKWSTEDEINFIKNLGTHRDRAREGVRRSVEDVPLKERLSHLKNYKKTMPLQVNWGTVDPVKIAEVVDEEICRLEVKLLLLEE